MVVRAQCPSVDFALDHGWQLDPDMDAKLHAMVLAGVPHCQVTYTIRVWRNHEKKLICIEMSRSIAPFATVARLVTVDKKKPRYVSLEIFESGMHGDRGDDDDDRSSGNCLVVNELAIESDDFVMIVPQDAIRQVAHGNSKAEVELWRLRGYAFLAQIVGTPRRCCSRFRNRKKKGGALPNCLDLEIPSGLWTPDTLRTIMKSKEFVVVFPNTKRYGYAKTVINGAQEFVDHIAHEEKTTTPHSGPEEEKDIDDSKPPLVDNALEHRQLWGIRNALNRVFCTHKQPAASLPDMLRDVDRNTACFCRPSPQMKCFWRVVKSGSPKLPQSPLHTSSV